MKATIGKKDLFTQLMEDFRNDVGTNAGVYQREILNARNKYFKSIREIFDLVRSENVAKESEQDPEFRRRVEMMMREGKEMMETIHKVTGG